MSNVISSLSICGKVTLNLHSLNNEGGEGNQIMTRQLTILDETGNINTVNGISGDMLKHIHASHLLNTIKEKGLELCDGCKVFNANRIGITSDFKEYAKNHNAEKSIDELIKKCVLDDVHGILVTDGGNLSRKSAIEFGWTVGIPGKNNTDTYLHTKLVPDAGLFTGNENANLGQNIFHRPANYGEYAIILHLEAYRIGYNDISREYPIDDTKRKNRFQSVMQALINTFMDPKGAMTSTQYPHITTFEGVITTSSNSIPAPTISALNSNYKDEIKKIKENFDNIDNFEINDFSSLISNLKELSEFEPYKL